MTSGAALPSQPPQFLMTEANWYEHQLPPASCLRLPQLAASPLATNLKFSPRTSIPTIRLRFLAVAQNHPSIPCVHRGTRKLSSTNCCYAAIALPGVNGGYRVQRDELGNRISVSPHSPVIETGNPTTDLSRRPRLQANHHQESERCYPTLGYLLQQQGVRSRSYLEPEWAKGWMI